MDTRNFITMSRNRVAATIYPVFLKLVRRGLCFVAGILASLCRFELFVNHEALFDDFILKPGINYDCSK